eukprot:4160787-Pyramimonas_sp.AAC.1
MLNSTLKNVNPDAKGCSARNSIALSKVFNVSAETYGTREYAMLTTRYTTRSLRKVRENLSALQIEFYGARFVWNRGGSKGRERYDTTR